MIWMDLQHFVLKLIKKFRDRLRAALGVMMVAGFFPTHLSAQVSEPQSSKEDIRVSDFDSFGKLRLEVLNLIGQSKTRIWLTTDYLTDGEIVSALFVARYRKLDVKVL